MQQWSDIRQIKLNSGKCRWEGVWNVNTISGKTNNKSYCARELVYTMSNLSSEQQVRRVMRETNYILVIVKTAFVIWTVRCLGRACTRPEVKYSTRVVPSPGKPHRKSPKEWNHTDGMGHEERREAHEPLSLEERRRMGGMITIYKILRWHSDVNLRLLLRCLSISLLSKNSNPRFSEPFTGPAPL